MKLIVSAFFTLLLVATTAGAADQGKHLFILSGQSNMVGLNHRLTFVPAVEEALGKENVIVIKDASGGKPISRWYKKRELKDGEVPEENKPIGDLYDRLMGKVNAAIRGKTIATVTFVWMQGESDGNEKACVVYEKSMRGLIDQLADDLKRDDINFVIGRISDYAESRDNLRESWEVVRKVQVKVAEGDQRGAWVDTDDLNDLEKDGKMIDGLHYTKQGYATLGKRFADQAIALIKQARE